MKALLEAISAVVANAPAKKVEQLAGIVSGVSAPEEASAILPWATAPEARERLKRLCSEWGKEKSISGAELSAMILSAGFIYDKLRNEQVVELVWTGPSSALVATRRTEQALLQVIRSAQRRLFLTSFVAYKVPAIVEALKQSLDQGVEVSILLERSESEGGGVSNDGIAAMKKELPEARVFAWDNKLDGFLGGKVHAKVAVADEAMCFISSANLTGHAMEKNMEAGVLIEGGALPEKLHRHLQALITTKQLSQA